MSDRTVLCEVAQHDHQSLRRICAAISAAGRREQARLQGQDESFRGIERRERGVQYSRESEGTRTGQTEIPDEDSVARGREGAEAEPSVRERRLARGKRREHSAESRADPVRDSSDADGRSC
jgi:hypothetical protein